MQGFWNLIGKSGEGPGKDFQYDIGEAALSSFDSKSIWTLHHGKKRANGDVVSVFICNAKVSSPDEFHLAKTAHKRLKTLRHPNIIKYLDGFESENLVYMVTEPVVPLSAFVDEKDGRNPNLINWGLYQVINGLSFLVNDVKLIHENVNIFSVFVGLDGEWKLGGVEYMHTAETTPVGKLPCLCRYDPPEGNCSRKREVWSADAWGLGCLIWEIHNGALQRASDLKVIEKIPKLLLLHYCDLVHANPKKRTNPKDFLQRCMESGQFFDNDFVKANLFLNEIQIKDTAEQKEFFISLNKSLDSFPKQFCVHKVLPQLLNAFEFGSAGSAVLSPLFKVGLLLDDVAYQAKIVPCIIKLFSSNDRATRIQLLQQMEKFVMHLQPSVVDNQIFACIATGFGDTLPAMREQTIKAMLLLAPKLSAKTFNNQLLRYFAKLQMDEQPGIRTNTTICLGKIAEHIPTETRQKVLVPAFTRGIHDPFPPARTASIMAISATHKYYSSNDIAVKLLPALCAATIDPERSVRENAFKVIKTFIMLLEDQSTELGDNAASSTDSSKQGNETGSTWTGWAVSSFTSRFYQNTPSSSGQSKEEISNKEKPVEQCAEKKSVETPPPPAVDVDRSSDHSNYDDAFDDDYWGDTKVENKPTESTLHQKMEDAHTKKAEIHRNKCDGDSDSDYGDWGEGGDGWGKENDDWESLDGLQSKSTKKNTEAFIEKPFSNEISSKSTQKPVSLLTNTKEVKDSSPVVQNKSLPLTSSNINWGDNATEWAGGGWDDNIGWDNEEKKKEEEKEKRKQDLQRKREEKKLQRELANKEKKAKSSGAMKLGAVKKNPKGDG